MLRVLQTEPCVLYWRTMMLMEYEFTAHLTPYGSLRVLHLLPAQPLHAHVVGVRGVGSWLGQRRRLTGRRQGWRWGRLCLGDQEMLFLDILIRKFVHSAHTDAHEVFRQGAFYSNSGVWFISNLKGDSGHSQVVNSLHQSQQTKWTSN